MCQLEGNQRKDDKLVREGQTDENILRLLLIVLENDMLLHFRDLV